MPWQCFMAETRLEPKTRQGSSVCHSQYLIDGQWVGFQQVPVGAMWWLELADGGKRLLVKLPGWHVVFAPYETTAEGHRWEVGGEPPNLTCTPSINCVGQYHGHINGGVISEDVEGRHYDALGQPVGS